MFRCVKQPQTKREAQTTLSWNPALLSLCRVNSAKPPQKLGYRDGSHSAAIDLHSSTTSLNKSHHLKFDRTSYFSTVKSSINHIRLAFFQIYWDSLQASSLTEYRQYFSSSELDWYCLSILHRANVVSKARIKLSLLWLVIHPSTHLNKRCFTTYKAITRATI